MVTVSRTVAGVILTVCLAIGMLIGVTTNNVARPSSALRGGQDAESRHLVASGTTKDVQERNLAAAASFDNLVWPEAKKSAFDGWGPAADEVFEIQEMWPEESPKLNNLMEDMSMSFSFEY